MWPLILTAAAGIAGSRIDSNTRAAGIAANNQAQREEAARQRKWNRQQWEDQNAYNTPSAQMARYQEAGLNPHLIYGQGSSAPGNADAVRGYTKPETESTKKGYAAFSDTVRNASTVVNANTQAAQMEVLHQNSIKAAYETNGIALSNAKKGIELGISGRTQAEQLQAAQANAEKAVSEARISHSNARTTEQNVPHKFKTQQIAVDQAFNTLKGTSLKNRLKQIEINLAKHGVQKHDNIFMRMMMQNKQGQDLLEMLSEKGMTLDEYLKKHESNSKYRY